MNWAIKSESLNIVAVLPRLDYVECRPVAGRQ